jgi:oligopeptide/dipeptide ABC transporter ATP-binding protein
MAGLVNHPAPSPMVGSASGADGSTPPMLEVENLVVHYPTRGGGTIVREKLTVHAVDDISFTVQRNETLALVGESGCGKSTTGRAVLMLERPTSGRVRFEGQDLAAMPRKQITAMRQHLQMVFQDPIAEPLLVHKVRSKKQRAERVAELLELVGLPADAADRYPHEFSGGQCQRVGIARALAGESRFIVLDEPVSALDVSIQAQILQLLTDLQSRLGLSYLFIAHDLAVVGQMSDRVAVMYLGQIVELAERDALYAGPAHPYTQALFSAVPDPSAVSAPKAVVVSGEVPSPVNPPSGCRFHTRCPLATERCQVEEPKLREIGAGHQVACHFAEEAMQTNPFALHLDTGGPTPTG